MFVTESILKSLENTNNRKSQVTVNAIVFCDICKKSTKISEWLFHKVIRKQGRFLGSGRVSFTCSNCHSKTKGA